MGPLIPISLIHPWRRKVPNVWWYWLRTEFTNELSLWPSCPQRGYVNPVTQSPTPTLRSIIKLKLWIPKVEDFKQKSVHDLTREGVLGIQSFVRASNQYTEVNRARSWFRGNFDLLFSKIVDMINQYCNSIVSTVYLNKISKLNAVKKSFPLLGCPVLSFEDLLAHRSCDCVIGSEKNLQN